MFKPSKPADKSSKSKTVSKSVVKKKEPVSSSADKSEKTSKVKQSSKTAEKSAAKSTHKSSKTAKAEPKPKAPVEKKEAVKEDDPQPPSARNTENIPRPPSARNNEANFRPQSARNTETNSRPQSARNTEVNTRPQSAHNTEVNSRPTSTAHITEEHRGISPRVESGKTSRDSKPITENGIAVVPSKDQAETFSGSDQELDYRDSEGESDMASLRITKPAPDWSGNAVVDGEFQTISLSDYKGKYLVFFFYPLDFTFVCPTEIIAFSDRVEEFRAIKCEVVACSTDSHFSHLAWINTPRKQGGLGHMQIPLLADKTCEISKSYGVLKADEGIAFRGLFIIDDKGNLRQCTINDLPVGRSVDETLRLVQAFQFTDKHGEVCPAGWKPGADTMKPDPKQSQSFFQKSN